MPRPIPTLLLGALLAWPLAPRATEPAAPEGRAALIAFLVDGEPVFEVHPGDIARVDATRARTGAPKLAIYLDEEGAEHLAEFTRAWRGRRLAVATCGEFLSMRRIFEPDIPGRIKVIFMDTDRSRAFRTILEAGEGC